MDIQRYRHPWLFYSLCTLVPWAFWLGAAFLSHREAASQLNLLAVTVLGIVGLASPALIALWMIAVDPDLRRDAAKRLFSFGSIRPVHALATCGLMLASILLAQAISLLFGRPASQFNLAPASSFSAGLLPGWFLLVLAPMLEELAWHSYGTDCLRARFSLLSTSLIFALFWALWHSPLSLIKGYYHAHLVETGWIYTLNFALSLLPFVVLMNWLYYKTGRNIAVAMVFHVTAGVFNEAFVTHPDSKVIQTVLLSVLAVALVWRDRSFFLDRDYREGAVT